MGFQFLRARYYDPATGRFISKDPFDALTHAAYGYASGNPVNFVDPLGLWTAALCAGGLVGAIVGGSLQGCIGIDAKGVVFTGAYGLGGGLGATVGPGFQFTNAENWSIRRVPGGKVGPPPVSDSQSLVQSPETIPAELLKWVYPQRVQAPRCIFSNRKQLLDTFRTKPSERSSQPQLP